MTTFEDVLVNQEPDVANFREEFVAGLRSEPRHIPCKFFYDARGSELFEQICELPEYYPTRTEVEILEEHADPIARSVGPRALTVEYGSGSGRKTELLLEMIDSPAGYMPIEISIAALEHCYDSLTASFPELSIVPICADYTTSVELPDELPPADRRIVFFPGSTIGNFEPDDARRFLSQTAKLVGDDGGLLIGVDLIKDREILEAAYNDSRGVTADFNLNLLRRANNELGADFDVDGFRHLAFFNGAENRIEMHLVSERDQQVRIDDDVFVFEDDEHLITEYSYKYRPDDFESLAATAGFEARTMWTDRDDLFSVWYLEVDSNG